MKATKYTQGPWHITEASGRREIAQATTERLIGEVYNAPGTDNREANARLIAAAPELAEAVRLGLKLSEAWLADCLQAGEQEDSMNVQAERLNIATFTAALQKAGAP